MKNSITYGGITVAPGEKASGFATVPGTDFKFPVTVINGKEDGKTFLATAGIHGAEYPGIISMVELSKEIDPKDVSGAIVLVHCVNMSGFEERQTYVVPADPERKNLNRLFPGNANGTLADKICAYISDEFAGRSDFHVDCHSGDMVEDLEACVICCAPKLSENNAAANEVAKCLSFEWRMNSGGRTECYNSSSIDKNVPSLLFERGCRGTWSREEVDAYKADLLTVAKCLKILPGETAVNPNQKFFTRHEWTEAGATGLCYMFCKVGDDIKEGQKIAEITDMFGNLLETVNAKFDGHVVITTSTLAMKKGDDLITYGEIEK
ncbi:MAG: succinylglutamate desuccinylase/aspartoacylase family protein [Clostridia bacterium]|nr:succinylglutamate desuccinylase/aspartoacylase family protein [Clostridia bacterium]